MDGLYGLLRVVFAEATLELIPNISCLRLGPALHKKSEDSPAKLDGFLCKAT